MADKKRTRGDLAKQVEAAAKKPTPAKAVPKEEHEDIEAPVHHRDLIPTGCDALNLALSDNVDGGYGPGRIVNVVGDSSTGKTILAMTGLAEMIQLPRYADHRVIYDDAEHADGFDSEKLFGKAFKDRVEPPMRDDNGEPVYSETVEYFEAFLYRAFNANQPFIYILDSLDSIDSLDEAEAAEENAARLLAGKDRKGSYGMAKAKKMSELFRHIKGRVMLTESLVIIISQTRQNIDPMGFKKKKRAGGDALQFYCTHVMWLTHLGHIKKKDEIIGNSTRIVVDKNKLTGKRRTIDLDIYYDYGVDNIGASVDWLVGHEFWKGGTKGAAIQAEELGVALQREKLIRHIENNNLERELRSVLKRRWAEYEDGLKLNRKPRFS